MADNLPAVPRETMMIADLEGQWAAVRNPVTGEVVPLDDVAALADWKIALKEHRDALTEAQRVVDELLLADMDRNASWTINRPGGSVRSTSPSRGVAKDQWDGNRLYTVLSDLVEQEVISAQARDSAVKITTEYAAVAKGVKALLAIPAVAPYVETCRAEVEPKKRSVSA